MSNFAVTLVNPPLSHAEVYGKYSALAPVHPPIGICALAAYIRQAGYDVRIVEAAVLGLDIAATARRALENAPRLVGIYANTANLHVVTAVAKALKKIQPEIQIVIGGPHPSVLPVESLAEPDFDFCVSGEGEVTLLELIRHLEDGGGDFKAIDGLSFRESSGRIIRNKPRQPIENLDSLPFPAVDLLPDLSLYRSYLLHCKQTPTFPVITSRGCAHHCTFCTTPFGKRVRFHSPRYVMDYIDYLKSHSGVREIFFLDDTFTTNEKRIGEMCGLMQSRSPGMSWYCNVRANFKDRLLFKEMKRAGCWIAAVGVESGDERILKLINKVQRLDEVEQTCRAVIQAGIRLKAFFILGCPGETEESIDRTIAFARRLKAHFPVFSLMTPYPGTELWETAEKYGVFDKTNFSRLLLSTADPVFIPFGLTKERLLEKQNEAFRKVYLNIPMFLRQIAAIDSPANLFRKLQAGRVFIENHLFH